MSPSPFILIDHALLPDLSCICRSASMWALLGQLMLLAHAREPEKGITGWTAPVPDYTLAKLTTWSHAIVMDDIRLARDLDVLEVKDLSTAVKEGVLSVHEAARAASQSFTYRLRVENWPGIAKRLRDDWKRGQAVAGGAR